MNKYFKELAQVLEKSGIETASVENGSLSPSGSICSRKPLGALKGSTGAFVAKETEQLSIILNNQSIGRVEPDGTMCLAPSDINTPEASELYFKIAPIAAMVRKYTKAMEHSPPLVADGLDEEFKVLTEFNGTVLAGRTTEYGMKFVTWDWNHDKTGLYQGHYYMDDYSGAKEDFAKRAGLVSKNRLFNNLQLTEMYRCMADTIDHEYELTDAQTKLIEDTQKQIEHAVPNLRELIAQSNEQELQHNM